VRGGRVAATVGGGAAAGLLRSEMSKYVGGNGRKTRCEITGRGRIRFILVVKIV